MPPEADPPLSEQTFPDASFRDASFPDASFPDASFPDATFSVPELCEAIRIALALTVPGEVWVRGEIRDLKRPKTGHVYFDLVEGGDLGQATGAKVAVALFANHKFSVNGTLRRAGGGVRMTDGVEVRLRGSLQFHPPTGRISLVMTAIDPAYTLGRLVADRDQLLRTLSTEGLLEANGRLPVSPAPLRIALVTSHDSAAHHDVLAELGRSGFGFQVLSIDTRVQGADAARTLVAAVHTAQRHDVDVIALVRGGGARTDLAVFDAEALCRAIAGCRVPVWTGIGHEIDRAVADEVAHTAWKTPTACAAALVDTVAAALAGAEARWGAIATRATASLDAAAVLVDQRARRASRDTDNALGRAEDRLVELARRTRREAEAALRAAERDLRSRQALVSALDPARTLQRGWSITRTADGHLVRSPGDAPPGTDLVTTTAGGPVASRVTDDSQPDTTEDTP